MSNIEVLSKAFEAFNSYMGNYNTLYSFRMTADGCYRIEYMNPHSENKNWYPVRGSYGEPLDTVSDVLYVLFCMANDGRY